MRLKFVPFRPNILELESISVFLSECLDFKTVADIRIILKKNYTFKFYLRLDGKLISKIQIRYVKQLQAEHTTCLQISFTFSCFTYKLHLFKFCLSSNSLMDLLVNID